MNLTSRPGRRLAAALALACSAILLPAAALASSAAAGTPAHPAAAALPSARPAASAAARPQRRQLAVTTLSSFKVVLTATRSPGTGPGPSATVTAAGYRHTSRGWKLIAIKRVGGARGWSWYATEVCSLTVTQLKPGPPSGSPAAVQWDSITVSLLWGPAIGCLRPYTNHWRP
ncbi:MAG: hypothetical protein ABSB01_24670 [Streptosporangiaceae bacterium]|jgi:hypothetical protein